MTTAPTTHETSYRPGDETEPHYPDRGVDSHTWGAFACVGIEMGGYNDLEAVNPYTGSRFWMGDAFHRHYRYNPATKTFEDVQGVPETTLYDALRELINEMEKAKFLG